MATLQFDYDCSGGRWVSVVAANRVLSQMTVSWVGPVDIQNSAAFFLLIKNRVVVNLTTEHKQWHTSLMSCCYLDGFELHVLFDDLTAAVTMASWFSRARLNRV